MPLKQAADDSQTRIKALILADSSALRGAFEREIADLGYDVQAVASAESAWEYFERRDPRLIVVNHLFSEIGGLELLERMRASSRGKYLTFLIVGKEKDHDVMEEAINAGVTLWINEPEDAAGLRPWLLAAHRNVLNLLEFEKNDRQLDAYKEEIELTNEQLEEAITRANGLAMKAELAYVEMKQIFSNAADGIRVIDTRNNVLRFNDTFLKIAGCTAEEVTKKKCYETFKCSLCQTAECPVPLIKRGKKRLAREVKMNSGADAAFMVTAIPFRAPDGALLGIIEYVLDISARVKMEEALRESEKRYKELSIKDELTGLFNKRHFNRLLSLEIERTRRYMHPLSLMLMDIDNFKHHNDTYGHTEGDKVLAALGELIIGSIRKTDFGCRYGGEEFTVIMPETKGEEAMFMAERIRERFASLAFYPRPEEKVCKTLSIGIAQYDFNGGLEEFVSAADDNMYYAKTHGKNRSCLK